MTFAKLMTFALALSFAFAGHVFADTAALTTYAAISDTRPGNITVTPHNRVIITQQPLDGPALRVVEILEAGTACRVLEASETLMPSDENVVIDDKWVGFKNADGNASPWHLSVNAATVSTPGSFEVFAQDDTLLRWADGFAFAPDGTMYFAAKQLNTHPALNMGEDGSNHG